MLNTITTMRLYGNTTVGSSSQPPDSQEGLATATFWAPKARRTV
jgi:hypothetical protein